MNKINAFIRFRLIGVPLREKLLFIRNLSIAVRSGMSLVSGLDLIKAQTKSKSMLKIIETLTQDINRGLFLSRGMERYPSVFDSLFVNVIRVGEASGTLHENLEYLASELTKKESFRKKVRGAMVYPVIVLLATVGVSVLLLVFLLPRLLPVFQNMKTELPLPTRILIATSNYLTSYGLYVALGIGLFFFSLYLFKKISAVRYATHYTYFFWPIVRRITVQANMANISRTLAILLRSGIKIVEAIGITAKVISNAVYSRELESAAVRVLKGEYLHKYLEKKPRFFPPTFSGLLAVGENTGNLIENLEYLNEYYEKDVDDFMKNISTLIEPLMLLVLGLTVGFIALATVLPIYQLARGF